MARPHLDWQQLSFTEFSPCAAKKENLPGLLGHSPSETWNLPILPANESSSSPHHLRPVTKEDSRVHHEGVAAPWCQDMLCKKTAESSFRDGELLFSSVSELSRAIKSMCLMSLSTFLSISNKRKEITTLFCLAFIYSPCTSWRL